MRNLFLTLFYIFEHRLPRILCFPLNNLQNGLKSVNENIEFDLITTQSLAIPLSKAIGHYFFYLCIIYPNFFAFQRTFSSKSFQNG